MSGTGGDSSLLYASDGSFESTSSAPVGHHRQDHYRHTLGALLGMGEDPSSEIARMADAKKDVYLFANGKKLRPGCSLKRGSATSSRRAGNAGPVCQTVATGPVLPPGVACQFKLAEFAAPVSVRVLVSRS